MRRLVLLLSVILAASLANGGVAAQQVSGMPRVGLLLPGSPEGRAPRPGDNFREGMRSLGWIEGSTLSIEDRFANGDLALLSANAAELAAEKVDVIVAFSSLAARAAHEATSVIPIVLDSGDPVRMGLVASLARPGGNITGLSWMSLDVVVKQLQILKEAVPRISKVGVLLQPDTMHAQEMTELERAAATLGVSVFPVPIGTAQDLPRRLDEMTAAGADSYFVLADPRTDAIRDEIVAFTLRHGLPGAAQRRLYVEAGVLLSYGINLSAIQKRLAFYVDKILKGAKPADLPVEQPTTFELVVNLKTAKTLGLTIPPSILARADEVIE
jgi:putative tryptophan/tyrosine transport system substrate-binding protein